MIKFRNNSYISDEQFNNIIVESKRQTQGLFSSIIENIEDVQFDNCINEAILDINQILNHVNDLMQLNRKDELLEELNRYFDNCTEGKVDYEVDKLGLMSNSLSGADRERQLIVVKEYFTFCLYRLFYLELIPKIVKALPPQQQPKTDYWQDDAEEITLIAEYQKAVNKLIEGGDTGCFPMRFKMLPRVVLNENTYSIERKKYLLKQMRLVLDEFKNTEIGRELFTDLYERIEPYADIFRFVFSETPLPPQPIVKQKPEQETPKTFDELFYNTDLVKPCIDILKELDPPFIDTDCNYIGKLKGIVCVWIDELQRQGIVKHYSDRKIFASLIPQKIKRFSIDESMFGKYQSKAEKNYRTDIKTMVSKIKLSQNSH